VTDVATSLEADVTTSLEADVATSLETRRRRARYRAEHRGTKEMDILLGLYAAATLATMTAGALEDFERLLAVPDPDLQGWLLTATPPTGTDFTDLVGRIRAFHGLTA
jgi:antitoxin CptB